MFTKVLKYDFLFSKTAFLVMAALMLGIAIVVKLASLVMAPQAFEWIFGIIAILTLAITVLAICAHVVQFFYKNFFSDAGYLMLTLPVSRGKLLASKMIVSFTWLLFMLVVGFFALFIFAWAQDPNVTISTFSAAFDLINLMIYINVILIALFIQSVLFLAVALSHSVFGRWQMPSLVSGIVVFMYVGAALISGSLLAARGSEWVIRTYVTNIYDNYGEIIGSNSWNNSEFARETGLRIGRIALGDSGAFIDIFLWGMLLGMTALVVFAVYFLLKHKASLE